MEQRKCGPWDACKECPLNGMWLDKGQNKRGRFVPASGPEDAKLLVVGEAPGSDESDLGYPFAGKSGKILRRAIERAGLNPETEVRYCNTVACQPPQNRNPDPLELSLCPQVREELAAFRGQVVMAVGRVAIDRLYSKANVDKLVKSRSTWDGYLIPAKELPARHELGGVYVEDPTKLVKSGKRKGQPKRVRKSLYAETPALPGDTFVVGVLHPAGVARKGFSNMFQMKAAVSFAVEVAKRGPAVIQEPPADFETNPLEWVVPGEGEGKSLVFDIENTELGLTRIGFAELDQEGKLGQIGSFQWNPATRGLTKRLLQEGTPYRELVAHNAAYDVGQLLSFEKIQVDEDRLVCTMMAAQLDQPDLPKALGAMWRYVGPMRPWKHLSADVPAYYNMVDVWATAMAWSYLRRKLAQMGQTDLLASEMRSIMVLDRMTRRGMRVDLAWVEEKKAELEGKLAKAVEEWQELSGLEVLTGKRVGEYLYEKHGLPVLVKTETGQPSTSESALSQLLELGDEIPEEAQVAVKALLEARGLQKLISTYLVGYVQRLDEKGYLHPHYLPDVKDSGDLGTAAGRLSSSPNVQNVPKSMRPMFIPDEEGWVVGDSDLSAIEGRVAAVLAGDEELLRMYDDPAVDMHTVNLENALAALRELWVKRVKEARSKQEREFWEERIEIDRGYTGDVRLHPVLDRRRIKTFLYGYQYGAGDRKIADSLGLHLREAETIRKAYEAARPKTAQWRTAVVEEARTKRMLQNCFGRVRYFQGAVPDQHVRNAAINFKPQSTVADMFWVMFPLAENLLRENGGRLLTQVHDSFVWTAPAENAEKVVKGLDKIMGRKWDQIAPGFTVPVSHEIGRRWGEGLDLEAWIEKGRPAL